MPTCFAPTCKHDYRSHKCKFYKFPANKTIFEKWKTMCRRADRDPRPNDSLCSCHFVDGQKANGPTIFEPYTGKMPPKFKRVKPPEINQPSNTKQTEPSGSAATSSLESVIARCNNTILTCENYHLERENQKLKSALEKGDRMSFDSIKDNDTLVFRYTGLPTADHIIRLLKLLERFEITYHLKWKVEKLSVEDQLLCTLMKLRLNLLNFDLAFRFKISTTTLQNIFVTFLDVIHTVLFQGVMSDIPIHNGNSVNCFAYFKNIKIGLDRTEIEEVPKRSTLHHQKQIVSHDKQKQIFKFLVGVALNGAITYVSELFPVSTSDKEIIKECDISSNIITGDLILCDKELLIRDMCNSLGTSINTLPQFANESVIITRQIAKAKNHVERTVSRIKTFKILDSMLPGIRPYASKIVQTCAALVNFQCFSLEENGENMHVEENEETMHVEEI